MQAREWNALDHRERQQILARLGQSVADAPRRQCKLVWSKLPADLKKALKKW